MRVLTTWFELTLEVPQDAGDAVANFLMEHGALGLQIEPRAERVRLTAYFSDAPPSAAVQRFCADIGVHGVADLRVRRVANENWAESWKTHFEPQLIGQRLYVCPPWKPVAPPGRLSIVIDPGMAFGTGHHPTTRGCLQLLERIVGGAPTKRALDVGTGSGILAIALAKLGVEEIWAVDSDPQACRIAATNARANEVDRTIQIGERLSDVAGTFDLVTANLFANALTDLAARLAAALRGTGTLICSGLLATDEPVVRSAYAACGLHLYRRQDEHPWVTLALRRKGPL